ncbi:MAG: efflux RND transporter permease subunit, partial [Geminicoccaceae bacterium]
PQGYHRWVVGRGSGPGPRVHPKGKWSNLEAAQAALAQARVELAHTGIVAPFAGVLDERPVEIGDFVDVGDPVATVIEQDPILVTGEVAETEIGRLSVGMPGRARLVIGEVVEGQVRYIAAQSNPAARTFKDPEGFARINRRPALALEVKKRIGANIVDTVAEVRRVVEAERRRWPPTLTVDDIQDKSDNIASMLLDLQNNVLSAILLVMIVVVAALGLRSAGLVGLAVPGSFLAGILVLGLLGLTINIVVLFALILAVGMLVDGAIVVTELADRKMAEGMPRRDAYQLAAKRMAWPITASTATTLAAFLPLLFWPGIVGEFMRFLPINAPRDAHRVARYGADLRAQPRRSGGQGRGRRPGDDEAPVGGRTGRSH